MSCDRGGNYKKKNEVAAPFYGNCTMKLICPFRLRYVPIGIGWKVMVKYGMHNHILDKDFIGHDILGRLKDYERKCVNDITKYNMASRYIVSALKDKDPENITSITQIYRARATYKLGKRGAMTEMQMLLILIHQEKYMCWTKNKENSDIVGYIFWAQPDFVKLLNMFPLVLIFDCTYKTNRVESTHWSLKNILKTSCGDLCASWDVVNTNLKLQLGFIRVSFQKSIVNIEHRYNVISVSVSMKMNITFFLLLIAPPPYTSRHTIIVVGFVDGNHWVQVKLRPDSPLPPDTDRWRKNCSNDAKA
ncbi:uncharacterized protein LOC131605790 [Vicia villosa]|uniref:uncharacterized protein LOC131605790 n=1 Tax=Vicia villosa TaxID=3911 RepID=UPI00273CED10|nr:uncharacterized protein LOC131605790 [Vicia villosa]